MANQNDSEIDNSGGDKTVKISMFQICEVLLLTPVMVIIIGLFLIPTVLYGLTTELQVVDSPGTCSQVSEYSGEVCRDELTSLQMCFSGVTSPLNIPSSIDQQTGETTVMSFVNRLRFLSPSQQCSEAIMPFLCLSIFSLCDSNNTLHTILRQDCLDIRDNFCIQEWAFAVSLNAEALPVCEDLLDLTVDCIDIDNSTTATSASDPEATAGSSDSSTTGSQVNQTSLNNSLECSNGFFLYNDENETELCRPICTELSLAPFYTIILVIVSFAIGFIGCLLKFMMAVFIQRDTLLVFPSILLVYLLLPFFVLSGLVLIGYSFGHLFCSSRDFIVAMENETPFCTITGIWLVYSLDQICILAVLHTVFLYWSVAFPISYRQFKISERIRYTHIICVVLAVVIPIPCGLVHLKDGFIGLGQPTVCCSRNLDYSFYTLIIPISITIAITSCFLVLIIWTIFKEFVLKKLLAKRKVTNVRKAEIKLTALTLYIIIMAAIGLVSYTDFITNTYSEDVTEFILCESTGQRDCQNILDAFQVIITLLNAFLIMLAITPVVVFLFLCNPQAFKMKYKAWKSS